MFQGGQCGRLVLEMSRGLVEYFMSFNTEADDSFMVISAMRNGMSYTRWLASFFVFECSRYFAMLRMMTRAATDTARGLVRTDRNIAPVNVNGVHFLHQVEKEIKERGRHKRMERLRRSFRESFRRRKDHVPESSKPHQWQSDEASVRAGTCNFYVKVISIHIRSV